MKFIIILITFFIFSNAEAQGISQMRRAMPSAAGGFSLVPAWSDNANVFALWYLEESGTTTRDNAETTATYDLSASASISNSSTAMQGSFSNDFAGTYLECTDATCGGSGKLDLTGSWTLGCWARPDVTSNLRRISGKATSTTTATSEGFEMGRNGSSALYCASKSTSNTSSNVFRVDMFSHAVCSWNGSALKGFINGNEVFTGAAANPAGTTENFRIGSRGTSDTANQRWDGLLDECFVIVGTGITAGQACRIARCGFDGEYCLCDDSPTTAYRPCATDLDCRVSGQITCSGGKCNGRPYSSCSTNIDCDIYSQMGVCSPSTSTCAGRLVGLCNGGSNNGQNCTVAADCTGGGTCDACTPSSCDDAGP